MAAKKIVKWGILTLIILFLLIWLGTLMWNRLLTELYGDEITNLNFYETETAPEYDWFHQESVLWSTVGTADTLIWPYRYHIVYYIF